MGSLLVIQSQRKGLKMPKKIQPFAKTQIIEDIKIISCYVNIIFFLFQMFFIHSAKFLLYKLKKITWSAFTNFWDLLLRAGAKKKEKKKNKYWPLTKFYEIA